MDKLFLAVVVSCVLALFAAAGLFVLLARDSVTAQASSFATRQRRH
jgi:hypothetical protein